MTIFNKSFRYLKNQDKNTQLWSRRRIKNGFMSRWNQASILASTFWLDDRLLFQPKKICEVSKTDWDSLIDVPLLPLTTDYMPSSFW